MLHAQPHCEKCAIRNGKLAVRQKACGLLSGIGQSRTGSKSKHDGVTVLLELCKRFEHTDSVDIGGDRIALLHLPEFPRIIIIIPTLVCWLLKSPRVSRKESLV